MLNNLYSDWNQKKIKKIIDYFGIDAFNGKNVLDVGCFQGDVSGALSRLGSRVIGIDARQENIQIAKTKYPHIAYINCNLERDWPFSPNQFDFIIATGIICHVASYKRLISNCVASGKIIILESEVLDSNLENFEVEVAEHSSIKDMSFEGRAIKTTDVAIERFLNELGCEFVRLDDSALNSGELKYNWTTTGSNIRNPRLRRFWIIYNSTNQIVNANKKQNIKPAIQYKEIIPVSEPTRVKKSQARLDDVKKQANSKYKVALCLSGHLRNFEQTFNKIDSNIIRHINPDVFISTWSSLGASIRHQDTLLNSISTKSYLHVINTLFNPKNIEIENPTYFIDDPIFSIKNLERREVNGLLSMFYKIKKSNDLKNQYESIHNFEYDFVLRLRTDLCILSPFPSLDSFSKDILYVPHGYDYDGLNDQVAFGSSQIMNKYSQIFFEIKKYLKTGSYVNPEKLLKRHINDQGIKVERFHLNYFIERPRKRF